MIERLPPEIILQVLSHASLPQLVNLQCTSKAWNEFFAEHETAIYRRAAFVHRLINTPDVSLEDKLTQLKGEPWDDEPIEGWKEFCRRSWSLEKNWQAKYRSRSIARVIYAAGNVVHRIKADEDAGICITSHMRGGLTVTDLGSPGGPTRVLWSLGPNYVRHYAHVEYENGFLVFDRLTGSKEVWRLKTSLPPPGEGPQVPRFSRPDDNMRVVSNHAASQHSATAPHGHFVPWALLRPPSPTRAYHLVFPTLVIVGAGMAYIYNIRTGERADINTEAVGLDVRYVELSASYIFISSHDRVHVYARQPQGGAHVLEIPAGTGAARVANVHVWRKPADEIFEGKVLERPSVIDWPPEGLNDVVTEGPRAAPGLQYLVSAHVTPDGRHLAVLCEYQRVILIQDWERVLKGEKTLEQCTMVVRIPGAYPSYLAVAENRFAVAATTGIYVFTLDACFHGLSPPKISRRIKDPAAHLPAVVPWTDYEPDMPFSRLVVSAARPWMSEGDDDYIDEDANPSPSVSCLQLTDRRLLFTWDVNDRGMPTYSGPPRGRASGSDRRPSQFKLIVSESQPLATVVDDGHGDGDDADGEVWEDEVEVEEVDGPPGLALVPWGPHQEVGCIDLSIIPGMSVSASRAAAAKLAMLRRHLNT